MGCEHDTWMLEDEPPLMVSVIDDPVMPEKLKSSPGCTTPLKKAPLLTWIKALATLPR